MRRFLTIGITGKGKAEILHGAEEDKRSHIDKFNEHAAAKRKSKAKSKFAEIQVIDLSSGVVKRKRFDALDGDGKRTIARTVKHKKKPGQKAAKKAARKTAKRKSPKKAATPKAPKVSSGSSTGASKDAAPALPAAKPE